MEPVKPTLGDKVKAAVAGITPPAMGGTAGTGVSTSVTAEQQALKRTERHEGGAGSMGGVGTGAGVGYPAGTEAGGAGAMGTTAGVGAGAGGRGGIAGGFERRVERAEEAVERVLHRATGEMIVDRPVVKEVRQEFVEHRPVAQEVETVTRVIGETAVEGGTRLEPVGPATERVVREGATTGMAAGGGEGRGVGASSGMTAEEERLEAERMRRASGGGGVRGGAI